MRPLALVTSSPILLTLQLLVSLWFVIDFFLARESSTAQNLWKNTNLNEQSSKIQTQFNQLINDLKTRQNCLKRNDPVFDKVIFIVIDALGAEFIPTIKNHMHDHGNIEDSELTMPFMEQSLRQNKAMGFVARAATPTVTMPRIKSLMSGTIPSFMDIVYNLAADVSNFDDDNILRIAKQRNKSLVFYGDDTWLSLFERKIFIRSKETFSFFAADYTSVDTNVTEMALPETRRDPIDWDYLILHYLGLDHIGHVFGSNKAPLISGKLLEMDRIIKEMHDNMAANGAHKTLLVICGDHGMSREGNHGGDTRLEAETALVFIPINHKLREVGRNPKPVLQVDFAATLSLLSGLPIPRRSRGVAIANVLNAVFQDDGGRTLCAALDNIQQLVRLIDDDQDEETADHVSHMLELLRRHHGSASDQPTTPTQRAHAYFDAAKRLQSSLIRTIAAKSNPVLVMLSILSIGLLSLINLRRASIRLLLPLISTKERLICMVAVVIPIVMQGSTNYIESENLFWPFFSLGLLMLFCLNAFNQQPHLINDIEPLRLGLFIVTFLITLGWNNLGILRDDTSWTLAMISVLILCNFSKQTSKMVGAQKSLFYLAGMITLTTKLLEETEGRSRDQLSFLAPLQIVAVALLSIITIANLIISHNNNDLDPSSLVQKLATSWMWLALLLARSRNYTFLIANVIMEVSSNSLANTFRLSPISRTILYLAFSANAFYGQGNTNLFSSLDVNPAFFGQTRYNIWLAIPLVASASFSSQIYWYLKLFQRVQGQKEQERMEVQGTGEDDFGWFLGGPSSRKRRDNRHSDWVKEGVRDFVDMRNFISLAYYMFVCIVLRNHLFIWSVISPKLVYHLVSNLFLTITTQTITRASSLAPTPITSS